jgi:hypothetical protein
MSKVQFIKTEHGEELAVLPRQEYERLKAMVASPIAELRKHLLMFQLPAS